MTELIILISVLIFVGLFLLSMIPGKIAEKKGYSFIGFWIFGLFLFFPALIIALCIPDRIAEMEQIASVIARSKTSVPTVTDELNKYYTLLQQEVISEEEFEAKKKQLLGL